MSLFDIGRPTGALGGLQQAEQRGTQRKKDNLEINRTQAEFFDYIDGIEKRKSDRAIAIKENEAREQVLPSETDKTISMNELAHESAEANKTLVEPIRDQKEREMQTQKTEEQFNQVTRAYQFFQDGLKSKANPQELYTMARKEMIRSSTNPEEMNEYLNQHGITEGYSEEAINQFGKLSTYGIYNAPTAREALLMDREWMARLKVARANAAATGKPSDTSIKKPTQDEITAMGRQLANYVPAFNDLQGTWTEEEGWTGDKFAAASAVANLGAIATQQNILGDPNVTSVEIEWIAADMMNYMSQDLTTDGMLPGFRSGGDDFDSARFINSATTGLALLDTYRPLMPNAPVLQVWKQFQQPIMQQLKMAQQQASGEGARQTSNAASTESSAKNTPAPVQEDLSGTPTVPQNMQELNAEFNKIQREIRGMSDKEKFHPAKGRARHKAKTDRYKDLLRRKNLIQNQRKKAQYKIENDKFEGALK